MSNSERILLSHLDALLMIAHERLVDARDGGVMSKAEPREREAIRVAQSGWIAILTLVASTAAVLLVVPLIRRTGIGSFLAGPGWWENLNLFAILLLVTAGVFLLGRLSLRDVGIKREKLVEGLFVILAAWAGMQVWPVLASGSAELARTWSDPGVLATLRWAAVMFLFTALWEELAFRGFLLPQLYLRLRGSHRWRLWGALLLSQIVFACAHVPAHVLVRDLSGGALLQMLVLQGFAGVLLGLLYLRTRNLWIAVGIHGLANAPTPLSGGALGWELPLIFLLITWPWITRRPHQAGLAAVVRLHPTQHDQLDEPNEDFAPIAKSRATHDGLRSGQT